MFYVVVFVFIVLGVLIYLIVSFGGENFWVFLVMIIFIMIMFGFLGVNFNIMVMELFGDIVGMVLLVIGFISMLGGVLLGYLMG